MKEKIQKLKRTCLKLTAAESECNSYLGGAPTAGSSFEWPLRNGLPLEFIAQLDLAEINRDQMVKWLPKSGTLMFFYDFEEWPWAFGREDKGGWAVAYEPANSRLETLSPPHHLKETHIVLIRKFVRSVTFSSYPDSQRIDFRGMGLSEGDEEAYWGFIDDLYGDEPRHQVGGFPSSVENSSMEEQCQLVNRDVYGGDSKDHRSDQAQPDNDWMLLFQFDTDDDVDVAWGDCGKLYYWVRESDVAKLEFSNSWLILQC